MNIYTLTLNPAYDIHAAAENLTLGCENLADIHFRQAGGKGVNISRALCSHSIPNTAVVVLGEDNCDDFIRELTASGVYYLPLMLPGRIRENLTVHCSQGPETRISFRGFTVHDSLLESVLQQLEVDSDTVITFTGSVPAGISKKSVLQFLHALSARGAKLVLDSKSLTPEDIFSLKPWLIKPNQEEISAWFGSWVETVDQAREKAGIFSDHGVVNVMVSLGDQGALLLSGGKAFLAAPPTVEVRSTIGAGDSSIAGFIAAMLAGEDAAGCLRTAVTYGTAACLTEGSLPPLPQDTAKILPMVTLKTLV